MSFEKCILNGVKDGIINKKQADQLLEEFKDEARRHDFVSSWMRLFNKKAKASKDYARALTAHTQTLKKMTKELESFPTQKEKLNYLNNVIGEAPRRGFALNEDVNRILNKGFEENGIYSVKKADFEEAVLAVIDGKKVDGKAANIKANLVDSFKFAKTSANKLGMVFGDLGEKYFPQSYSKMKVGKMSEDDFVKLMLKNVDLKGESVEKMTEIFRVAKRQIETEGLDLMAGFKGTVGVVENQNLARSFHFKDGSGYLEVMKAIGSDDGDVRKIAQSYFFGITQEMGMARQMGPLSRDLMETMGKKISGEAPRKTRAMYNVVAGTAFSGDRNGVLYKAHTAIQNQQRAALLGSASVSALTDFFYSATANFTNGGSFFKPLKDYSKVILPFLGKADLDATIKKMGYYSEVLSGNMLEENRFAVGGGSEGTMKKLADTTFKLSGLDYLTRYGKIIGQLNSNHLVSDAIVAKKAWGKITPILRERLEKAGFDEAKWKTLSDNLEINNDGRMNYFNTSELKAKHEFGSEIYKLAEDIDLFTKQMADFVTNEGRVDVRALTSGAVFDSKGQASIAQKVVLENVTQFKNFPMTVMMNHFFPAIEHAKKGLDLAFKKGEITEGVRMMSEIFLMVGSTSMMGVGVIQIRNLIKGKTTQDFDGKTMAAGFLQGGSMGILGDFLFKDTNRFGNSIWSTLAGPSAGFVEQVYKATRGNTVDSLVDNGEIDLEGLGKDAVKLLKRNTPVLSSLWYSRLMTERLLFDSLERLADPRGFDRKNRRAKRRLADKGQEFWWGPGEKPKLKKIDPTQIVRK